MQARIEEEKDDPHRPIFMPIGEDRWIFKDYTDIDRSRQSESGKDPQARLTEEEGPEEISEEGETPTP